jgi:IS605 OrfB family transposase
MQRAIKTHIENKYLKSTIEQYFKAYCFCIDKGMEMHTSNKIKIHNATYYPLRNMYPKLTPSLLQTARDIACENLKSIKLKIKPMPKNKFIRFNRNSLSYRKGIISLSTINGRQKFQIKLPKFAEKYNNWNCKAGTVTLRNGQLWLNMIFNKDSNLIKPKTFLGIDRGITNIVVCSDNQFYNSKRLKAIKGRYKHLKSELQSTGTRSAKRKLKIISGRERRFVRDVNHCLSKEIANKQYDCFVLEDLKKIPRDKGRRFNSKLGNWSFNELGEFVKYKAEELGKSTMKVNPMHTSQRCSKCGHMERLNRKGSRFKCRECGFELDADLNASRNIAYLGISQSGRLNVIQPNVAASTPVTSPLTLEMDR